MKRSALILIGLVAVVLVGCGKPQGETAVTSQDLTPPRQGPASGSPAAMKGPVPHR